MVWWGGERYIWKWREKWNFIECPTVEVLSYRSGVLHWYWAFERTWIWNKRELFRTCAERITFLNPLWFSMRIAVRCFATSEYQMLYSWNNKLLNNENRAMYLRIISGPHTKQTRRKIEASTMGTLSAIRHVQFILSSFDFPASNTNSCPIAETTLIILIGMARGNPIGSAMFLFPAVCSVQAAGIWGCEVE